MDIAWETEVWLESESDPYDSFQWLTIYGALRKLGHMRTRLAPEYRRVLCTLSVDIPPVDANCADACAVPIFDSPTATPSSRRQNARPAHRRPRTSRRAHPRHQRGRMRNPRLQPSSTYTSPSSVRCGYCDFNTYATEDFWRRHRPRHLRRRRYRRNPSPPAPSKHPASQNAPCITVFFGGGTPTKLPARDLVRILHAAIDVFGLVEGAEVTTEANPDSVTREDL